MFFNIGKKSYNKGYETGYDTGYLKGYSQAMNDINKTNQEEVKETKEQPQQSKSQINRLDDLMLWYKSISEIIGTKFFMTTLYKDNNSNDIDNIIKFIDYIENNFEIKLTYPETYYYLPELKKEFKKIYQNKLVTEEAENLIK